MLALNLNNSRPKAADAQKINKGIFGNSCVAALGSILALSVNISAAKFSMADGLFCFDGRIGRISGSVETEFLPPASGFFKKIVVGVLYQKNILGVERFSISAYSSASAESVQAAALLNAELPQSEIKQSTSEAFMPLWSFVCSNDTIEQETCLFEICKTPEEIANIAKALELQAAEALENAYKIHEEIEELIGSICSDLQNLKESVNSAFAACKEKTAELGEGLALLSQLAKRHNEKVIKITFSDSQRIQLQAASSISVGLYFANASASKSLRLNAGKLYVGSNEL